MTTPRSIRHAARLTLAAIVLALAVGPRGEVFAGTTPDPAAADQAPTVAADSQDEAPPEEGAKTTAGTGEASPGAIPATAGQDEGENPIAVVNGETITLADLERRLVNMHSSMEGARRSDFDIERLLNRLVNDRLLAQEARALGLDEEEDIRAAVERTVSSAMVGVFAREEIDARVEVPEEEIRRAFDTWYRTVTLRVLTVDTEEEADEILELLRDGADMDALARERSVDPYGPRGGLASELARRDVIPGVRDLAFSSKPGNLAGPVSTDLGWTVVKVESFGEPDPELFMKVADQLRDGIAFERKQALKQAITDQARERHPVRIDQQAVDGVVPERSLQGSLRPRVENPDAVAARVGEGEAEVTITVAQYGKALNSRWGGMRSEIAARESAPIILDRLIRDALLSAEARARGYDRHPDVLRAARGQENQLLVDRYLQDVIAADIEVSDEEIRKEYEENRDRFGRPPRLRLGQITVETLEEAERIAALLREGTDLGWLAEKHSTDRFAEARGDRGWTVPNPGSGERDRLLLDARPGDVLDPSGMPGSYAIVKVLAREEQGVLGLEDVRPQVHRAVFSDKYSAVVNDLLAELRKRSEIGIDEDAVSALSVRGTREAEDAGKGEGGGHGH